MLALLFPPLMADPGYYASASRTDSAGGTAAPVDTEGDCWHHPRRVRGVSLPRAKLAAVAACVAVLVLPAATSLAAGGSLDPAFGSSGTTILNGYDATKMRVAPDGKIVVVGSTASGFSVIRLNTDGSLDTTFDGDGIVDAAGIDIATAVAFGPGDKIVVAGAGGAEFATVRLNDDGSFDTTYSG